MRLTLKSNSGAEKNKASTERTRKRNFRGFRFFFRKYRGSKRERQHRFGSSRSKQKEDDHKDAGRNQNTIDRSSLNPFADDSINP